MQSRADGYRSIAFYAIAMLVVAGSNFLTTPLLLRLLGTEGFADWALLEPFILIAMPLAGLGVQMGLLNLIRESPDVAGKLLPVHLGFAAVFAGLIGVVSYVLLGPTVAACVSVIMFVEGGIVFMISFWRVTNRPGWYAIIEGGRSASVMLTLLAMTLLPMAAVSEVTEYLVLRAGFGTLFFGGALIVTRWHWQPDIALARRAIWFGLPLGLSAMSVTMIMNLDRYFVASAVAAHDLSVYVAHVKTTQILGSALAPFFTWFAPVAIARLQTGKLHDGFLGRSFFAFMAVNFALCLGLWLMAPIVWDELFPEAAYSKSLMTPLVLGMVVFAAGNPLSIGCLQEGRTNHALLVTLLAAVTGGIACLALVQHFGAVGVAWAKAFGMTVYTCTFAILTWRRLRITYPWGMITALAAMSGTFAVLLEPIVFNMPALPGMALASFASILVLVAAFAMDRGFIGMSRR